ncbi:MAG: tetratricopeptide repeat protein [Dehalococcoidia bacterium]
MKEKTQPPRPKHWKPTSWKPLYVIGGITIAFLFAFACGAVLFAVSNPDVPEDPTPIPRATSAEEYVTRGLDFADQGDFQNAILDFTEALRLAPEFYQAYYNRGITYNKLKQYQQAIDDFTRALELNPSYAAAYANRAFSYTILGIDAQALEDVERAVELGENREQLEQVIEGARQSRE